MNKGVKNKIPAIEADCIQLFIRSTRLLLIEFLQTQLAELKSFIGCDCQHLATFVLENLKLLHINTH